MGSNVFDYYESRSDGLNDVYYEGSEADRENISIADNKEALLNATWHYNYTEPEGEKKVQNITVSEIGEKVYGDAEFKLEVTPDETAQLTNFTFESDDENVAAVDGEGNITIKGAGEANITVREAGNDEYAAFEYAQKLVVNKAKITVRAENKSKKTGNEDPELTYTYEGTLFGDDAFTGALEREAGETVGVYDILQGTLKINDNYDITFVKGKFEIADKTVQNISVSEIGEKVYGDAGFKLEVTPDKTAQLTNFTFESDDENVAAVDGEGNIAIKGAGEANITVREAGNDEYAAFEDVQKLVVNRKKITISALDLNEKTAEFEGIIEDDKVGLDFEKITLSDIYVKDDGTASVTVQNLTLTGSGAANYVLETSEFVCEVSGESIATVTFTAAENGEVTGSGSYLKGSEITLTATPNNGYKLAAGTLGTREFPQARATRSKLREISSLLRNLPKSLPAAEAEEAYTTP